MAGVKVSQLASATTIQGIEILPVIQGTDDRIAINATLVLKSYSKNALPSATMGTMVYVNDASGGATAAFFDGAVWRRPNLTVVS